MVLENLVRKVTSHYSIIFSFSIVSLIRCKMPPSASIWPFFALAPLRVSMQSPSPLLRYITVALTWPSVSSPPPLNFPTPQYMILSTLSVNVPLIENLSLTYDTYSTTRCLETFISTASFPSSPLSHHEQCSH